MVSGLSWLATAQGGKNAERQLAGGGSGIDAGPVAGEYLKADAACRQVMYKVEPSPGAGSARGGSPDPMPA